MGRKGKGDRGGFRKVFCQGGRVCKDMVHTYLFDDVAWCLLLGYGTRIGGVYVYSFKDPPTFSILNYTFPRPFLRFLGLCPRRGGTYLRMYVALIFFGAGEEREM